MSTSLRLYRVTVGLRLGYVMVRHTNNMMELFFSGQQ